MGFESRCIEGGSQHCGSGAAKGWIGWTWEILMDFRVGGGNDDYVNKILYSVNIFNVT